MSKHIIGKGTWLDKLASKLVEREIHLGRSMELIKVESGIGASGIPHIGSLGDAVRAYGVSLALTNMGTIRNSWHMLMTWMDLEKFHQGYRVG